MKIVNNKIYITRGETPTYDVRVIDRDTGAPLMVGSGINNPLIEFIVRPSVYDRDDDYAFKTYLIYEGKTFNDSEKIETYTVTSESDNVWSNDYAFLDSEGNPQDQNALFRKEIVIGSNEWEYRYFDANATGTGTDYKWIPYEFRITFSFPYEATAAMESKQYRYEVTLFGGTLKSKYEENEIPIVIDYKKPLLEATEFVVGGSLSE